MWGEAIARSVREVVRSCFEAIRVECLEHGQGQAGGFVKELTIEELDAMIGIEGAWEQGGFVRNWLYQTKNRQAVHRAWYLFYRAAPRSGRSGDEVLAVQFTTHQAMGIKWEVERNGLRDVAGATHTIKMAKQAKKLDPGNARYYDRVIVAAKKSLRAGQEQVSLAARFDPDELEASA